MLMKPVGKVLLRLAAGSLGAMFATLAGTAMPRPLRPGHAVPIGLRGKLRTLDPMHSLMNRGAGTDDVWSAAIHGIEF
jgi:hypothetical protein